MNVSNMYIGSPNQNPTGMQRLMDTVNDGAGAATFTISNIPARRILRIVVRMSGKSGADTQGMQFNGDTGNNYSYKNMTDGAAAASITSADRLLFGIRSTTLTQTFTIDIQNLNTAGATKSPTWNGYEVAANAATQGYHMCGGGNWHSGNQITSITFLLTGANTWGQNCQVDIFGSD